MMLLLRIYISAFFSTFLTFLVFRYEPASSTRTARSVVLQLKIKQTQLHFVMQNARKSTTFMSLIWMVAFISQPAEMLLRPQHWLAIRQV